MNVKNELNTSETPVSEVFSDTIHINFFHNQIEIEKIDKLYELFTNIKKKPITNLTRDEIAKNVMYISNMIKIGRALKLFLFEFNIDTLYDTDLSLTKYKLSNKKLQEIIDTGGDYVSNRRKKYGKK